MKWISVKKDLPNLIQSKSLSYASEYVIWSVIKKENGEPKVETWGKGCVGRNMKYY